MITPNFKTVLASVRPARIAVLIDQRDEDWQAICLRVIEFLSTAWGGSYNIIIPTDVVNISDTFWQILDAFNPDYFFFYYKTGEDIKLDHPEKFQERLEARLQQYLRDSPGMDISYARQQIDKLLLDHHLISEIPDTLQLQMKKRLAPFHFENRAVMEGIGIGSKAEFPLAPLTKVLPNSEPSKTLLLHKPLHGGLYPLWLASITGLAGDNFDEIFPQQRMILEYDDYEPIEFVLQNGLTDSTEPEDWATPFQLTNVGLGLYRPKHASTRRGPAIVVAGDSVSDFCLYYALTRLRNQVVWMPHAWLKSEPGDLFEKFARKLALLKWDIDTHPRFIFTSHSLGEVEIAPLLDELKRSGWNSFESEAQIQLSLDNLLKYPLRMYERDNVDKASTVIVREGAYIDIFNTPKPKNFSRLHPYEHRWITDVHILHHQLPRHHLLGKRVVRHPIITEHEARISRHGISFFCPNPMYAGGDIDTTLIRPDLFIPDAHQVFEYILNGEGYQSALSDKGVYAQRTLSKFGTLEALGSTLRDENYRNLLLKYLDKPKPGKGVHDEGCALTDKRRYLNFPTIAKIIGDEKRSQEAIEILARLGILYRGYVLKCGICKDAAWFGLEEVSQTFRCKRCGSQQYITRKNYWYGAFEPGLYYKLDEIVYQFIQNNGYVATLALDQLRMRCENSFLFTPDLELIRPRSNSKEEKKELDILCIRDGIITLGEAKKENRLGVGGGNEVHEIRKYFYLAKEIGARALVFATFSDAWSPETIKNVNEIVTDKAIEVITLTRQELLSGK